MFNLIAQYIGFAGEESEPVENDSIMDCAFGEREDDDWTLVDVRNKKENRQPKNVEEFHRVPTPAPLESLHSSVTSAIVDDIEIPVRHQVTNKQRVRCFKNPKRQRVQNTSQLQHRPNQMKRSNQVLCYRGNKASQKMRQIVHQPRKC